MFGITRSLNVSGDEVDPRIAEYYEYAGETGHVGGRCVDLEGWGVIVEDTL